MLEPAIVRNVWKFCFNLALLFSSPHKGDGASDFASLDATRRFSRTLKGCLVVWLGPSSGKYCAVANLAFLQRVILVARVSLLSLREGVWLVNLLFLGRLASTTLTNSVLAVLVEAAKLLQWYIRIVREPWSELDKVSETLWSRVQRCFVLVGAALLCLFSHLPPPATSGFNSTKTAALESIAQLPNWLFYKGLSLLKVSPFFPVAKECGWSICCF